MRRIPLPFDPSSARLARHCFQDWLAEVDQRDLDEVGSLLVTELVTNAILHARTDAEIRFEATPRGVHVEVADDNPVKPTYRSFSADATTGRGLAMIDRMATAWGVRGEASGKAVWFQLGEPDPALVASLEVGEAEIDQELVTVVLSDVPVGLRATARQQDEALIRELALIAFDVEHSLAGEVAPIVAGAERARSALSAAWAAAEQAIVAGTDTRLAVPRGILGDLADLIQLLELADRLAEQGHLLTPSTLPELRHLRNWFLAEAISQLEGAEATPWRPELTALGGPTKAGISAEVVLAHLADGIVVADSTNHIVYANAALERMLGWDPGGLIGQRLLVLVPQRYWDAHLAGFTQFLLTREERVLGRPLRLPAATHQGREVPVELVITTFGWDDRPAFVGRMRDLSEHVAVEQAVAAARAAALAVVNEVSVLLVLSGDAPLPVVGPKVLAAVGEGLGWQVGSLWLLDDGRLQHRVWWQASPGFDEFRDATLQTSSAPVGGFIGRVQAAGAPIWVADIATDGAFRRREPALASGLHGAFAFPVLFRGEVLGVAEIFGTSRREPDEQLLAVIETIGLHLGLYLQHHPDRGG